MSLYSTLLPAACPPAGLVPARAKPRAVEHSKLQATPGRRSPAGAAGHCENKTLPRCYHASIKHAKASLLWCLRSLLAHWCYLYLATD